MAMHGRYPVWLPAAPKAGISVFACIYFIETFARATLATVVPLQAYELIQSAQYVSMLYTSIAVAGLSFSLILPLVITALSRRWTFTLGAVALMGAALCFVTYTIVGQGGGMLLRVIGTSCLNVTLNLYVLDTIRKKDYVKHDTIRLTVATLGWTTAPYAGVWLYTNHGPWATYSFSIVCAILLTMLFWYLRLSDNKSIRAAKLKPVSPIANVGRFLAQPRLRLAWIIAFGRSSFWSTLFVYGPILMVSTGQGQDAGGLLVSAANVMLITALGWGKLGERWGVRRTAVMGFWLAAAFLIAAGLVGTSEPLVTAGLLLAACFFAIPLDAVGNVPFYRAVHPHERAGMTAVYRTYLDFGELIPPMIYAVLLGFFGLGAVFVANGVVLAFCGFMTWRFLNARL